MRAFKTIFLISFLLYSCNDVVNFSLEDAQKQPWLFAFVKNSEIREGKHNLRDGIVKVYLNVKSSYGFLEHADSIATLHNWETGYSSNRKRVYIKDIPDQSGDGNIVIIKMTYFDEAKVVELIVF